MHAEVLLPFGVVDLEGKRVRKAVLTPITGRGELQGADEPNPFRAVLPLLAASTLELGRFRGAEIDAALIGGLLPVDRDHLLLHLNRLTFGDLRYHIVECPQASCRRRLDVQFALSSAEPPPVPASAENVFELADGRQIRFRLPLASDQAALHGVSPSALEAAFLQRCVREDLDDRDAVRWPAVMDLPATVRADLVKHIVGASPEFDLAVPLTCPECGRLFRFVFEPVLSLLTELNASRSELIKQVHRLALSYHWSHSEILELPRPLRHEYLQLVQEEAAR